MISAFVQSHSYHFFSTKKSECLCLIEMKNRMPKSSHKGLKPSFELITKYFKYLMLVTIQ